MSTRASVDWMKWTTRGRDCRSTTGSPAGARGGCPQPQGRRYVSMSSWAEFRAVATRLPDGGAEVQSGVKPPAAWTAVRTALAGEDEGLGTIMGLDRDVHLNLGGPCPGLMREASSCNRADGDRRTRSRRTGRQGRRNGRGSSARGPDMVRLRVPTCSWPPSRARALHGLPEILPVSRVARCPGNRLQMPTAWAAGQRVALAIEVDLPTAVLKPPDGVAEVLPLAAHRLRANAANGPRGAVWAKGSSSDGRADQERQGLVRG